jgi:hypothetical protein
MILVLSRLGQQLTVIPLQARGCPHRQVPKVLGISHVKEPYASNHMYSEI